MAHLVIVVAQRAVLTALADGERAIWIFKPELYDREARHGHDTACGIASLRCCAGVMEARKACEAAALEAHAEAATEPAAAFKKLAEDILPAESDEPKRRALNQFMTGLRELRNPVAHGHSETQINRAEAELALTVAVSLFRYIGEVSARRG